MTGPGIEPWSPGPLANTLPNFCTEYKNETEGFHYYGNMRHNLSVPDAFAEVMKVTN